MAIRGCTGFEYGLFSANSGGLFSNSVGTPVFDTAVKRSGSYSLKINQPAAAAAVRLIYTAGAHPLLPASQNVVVLRFYYRVDQFPSATTNLFEIGGGGVGVRIEIDPSGNLNFRDTGSYASEIQISTGTWYRIEVLYNNSANPWVFDWSVDGVAMTQRSSAQAANTASSISIGTSVSTTLVAYYDDLLVATDDAGSTADYPLGAGFGEAILPGSDGTHSFTANDFSTGDAGTQRAPSYTDFHLMVDDAPPWVTARSTTDNIAQRVIRTTGYVELIPAAAPSGRADANAVTALEAWSSPATQANRMACIIRNGDGTAAVIYGDLPSAQGGNGGATTDYSDTANQFSSVLLPAPAAGWSETELNAIRWRLGGSGDIAPVPTVQALILEVDWPQAQTIFGAASLTTTVGITTAGAKTTFGVVSRSTTVSETTAGTRTTFGSASLTETVAIATAGARLVRGAASLTTSVGIDTAGIRSTFGSLSAQTTVDISTAGTRSTSGSSSLTTAVGISTVGARTTFGSVSRTTVVGISVSGTRSVAGACSLTTTVGIDTAGIRTTFGAVSRTTTVTISTNGTVGTTWFGAASLTTTAQITTSGQRTTFGAVSRTTTVTIFTNGTVEGGGTTWFGAASLTTTVSIATDGQRTATGQASLTTNVSISTVGLLTVFGRATLTETLLITTRGKLTAFGQVDRWTLVTITTNGQIPAQNVPGTAVGHLSVGANTISQVSTEAWTESDVTTDDTVTGDLEGG